MPKSEEFPRMTPEEIASARIQEAEMVKGGAEVDREGRLIATGDQKAEAKREMIKTDSMSKDLGKYFTEHDMHTICEGLRKLEEGLKGKYKNAEKGEETERIEAEMKNVGALANRLEMVGKGLVKIEEIVGKM